MSSFHASTNKFDCIYGYIYAIRFINSLLILEFIYFKSLINLSLDFKKKILC